MIKRDARGVPFIQAATEAELYFAQGYATASDRLWQMDFLRRTARGELAEIFGAGAVETDKLHRIYGFRRVAEKLLEGASDETRAVLESYARGVNALIEERGAKNERTAKLPLEFQMLSYEPRPWTPIDSLALGKLFAENLSFTIDADLLRALLSDLPRDKVATLLPETSPLDLVQDKAEREAGRPKPEARKFSDTELAMFATVLKTMRRARAANSGDSEVGSNSWVVSGDKTASRQPLLASDPHLPPTSPSIWHIVHLQTGDLRVAGVAVPGVPGVMIGHNDWIAWGITNLCPDVQDLYVEQFDGNSYKTPHGWRAAEIHREEIAVRKSADVAITIDVKVTRHGPVIFENGSTALSVQWTALDTNIIDLDAFLAVNRARNWDEFVTALSRYGGPPQNFTYADTSGHIGYHTAGCIPIRKTGDGSLPYDGTTDDGEWIGYVPLAELPHAFDPPSGVVVQANQRVVDLDYKHHLTHNWRVPYRARRIHELLQTKDKFTIDDFLAIQGDTYSYPDAIFASEIAKLGSRLKTTSSEWATLVAQLEQWDGYANADSTVLPIVAEMRKTFRTHVLTHAIGAERAELYEWRNEATFIDNLITQRPHDWLPGDFDSYESLILACYRETIDKLTAQLGPDQKQWTWGELAQVRFPHPLERLGPHGAKFATRSFPQNTGGSMPTVNAGARVSLRYVADLSEWDETRLCVPLGESGELTSPHREDQLDEWRNLAPAKLRFSSHKEAQKAQVG